MLFPYIKEAGLTWMLPIIFLSFCAVAFCLERLCYWLIHWKNALGRKSTLRKLLSPPFNRKKVQQTCLNSQDHVLFSLGTFLKIYENVSLPIAERKARMFAEEQVEESRRFLDLLSLISNISGTLGLMGTVVGISLSFKSLVSEDSRALALSLSTAMYTTIGGIILFLISYLFFFFLSKFSDSFENDLDINVNKLKDLLEIEEKSAMVFEAPKPKKKRQKVVEPTKSERDPQPVAKAKEVLQPVSVPVSAKKETA